MISAYIVKENVTDYFLDILNNKRNMNRAKGTCTVNGWQTENIIELVDRNILKDLGGFYPNIFHLHLIEYYQGGYQLYHNHIKTEEESFILYLNDCPDGDTIFEEFIKISPRKNILVHFLSNLNHRGDLSWEGKKILVGAIK